MSGGRVDRSELMGRAMQEALGEQGWMDKVKHVVSMVLLMVMVVLPQKLGWWGQQRQQPPVRVQEGLVVATHHGHVNVTAIRHPRLPATLVLGAPPAFQAPTLCAQLGHISAVLILDALHETYAHEFVQAVELHTGRRPTVLALASQRRLVEQAVRVDQDAEDSPILKEFGLTRIVTNGACRHDCGAIDAIFIFDLAGGKRVAVGSCGFGNLTNSWWNWLLGFGGRRVLRLFGLSMCKNMAMLRKTWDDAIKTNPDVFIPQHGDVVPSHASSVMRTWVIA